MTATDPRSDYAAFTRSLIEDFRAHNGKTTSGPFTDSPLLLLHTVGARSGEPRIAPLIYSRDGDRLVIIASKSGAPSNPAWFANVVAHPDVTVEAGGETFRARAVVHADGPERDRLWEAHKARFPRYAEYEQKTTRLIPVVVLERIG